MVCWLASVLLNNLRAGGEAGTGAAHMVGTKKPAPQLMNGAG